MTKNITFTLPAVAMEGASEAYLVGDFNNWNPEHAPKLEKQKDGSYKTVAKLEEGKTYQYRFLLNNGRWVNDYNAQNYPHVHGLHIDNSEITVPVSEKEEGKKEQPAKAGTAAPKESKSKVEKKATDTASKEAPKATSKTASEKKTTEKTAIEKPAAKAPVKKAPAKKSTTSSSSATGPKAEKTSKPAAKKTTAKAAPKPKK